jgi:hypothetical protein
MMITRKALSRRTMLKALGAALPLPLLDAMVPALTAIRQTPARPALRFGAVYVPNGVIPAQWFPAAEGSGFEFSPTLKPLEPFRDRLLVLSGLDSLPPPPPGERQYNNHADASTRFLTDVTPSRSLRAGVSIDQIAAKVLSRETMLPSLELALESVDSGTSCDFGRSCVYTGTIAWAGPTSPLPMEHDPGAAFCSATAGPATPPPGSAGSGSTAASSIRSPTRSPVSRPGWRPPIARGSRATWTACATSSSGFSGRWRTTRTCRPSTGRPAFPGRSSSTRS